MSKDNTDLNWFHNWCRTQAEKAGHRDKENTEISSGDWIPRMRHSATPPQEKRPHGIDVKRLQQPVQDRD